MNLARRRTSPIRLNLSPLIDVVFILLIFVILVARFVDQERLDVTLPSAAAGRPAELAALEIVLKPTGRVRVGGAVVEPSELDQVLRAARSQHDRAVLIADGASSIQRAVDVISAAKLAGFDQIAVATRPPDP